MFSYSQQYPQNRLQAVSATPGSSHRSGLLWYISSHADVSKSSHISISELVAIVSDVVSIFSGIGSVSDSVL